MLKFIYFIIGICIGIGLSISIVIVLVQLLQLQQMCANIKDLQLNYCYYDCMACCCWPNIEN